MEPIATHFDSRGHKTTVYDNVMPQEAIDLWTSQRKQIKFYKTIQDRIPMSFRVHAVDREERDSFFALQDWIGPYLKDWHEDITTDHFNRSFINCYQKDDHILLHADLDAKQWSDDHRTCVALLFLTPDSYINDPDDCGFIISDGPDTNNNFVVSNKFNRLILMDARSYHEPIVPSDNVQRLTLYAGYTLSPLMVVRDARREKFQIMTGVVPGTNYTFDVNDYVYMD